MGGKRLSLARETSWLATGERTTEKSKSKAGFEPTSSVTPVGFFAP